VSFVLVIRQILQVLRQAEMFRKRCAFRGKLNWRGIALENAKKRRS